MSIILSSINESLDKDLAIALSQMDKTKKSRIMRDFTQSNIDFNRSIKSAVEISPNDPRLKGGNGERIILGVYTNADTGTKDISVWKIYDHRESAAPVTTDINPISVLTPNNKVVKLPKGLSNVSWTKWISYMSSIYIIEDKESTPVDELRTKRDSSRYKSKEDFHSDDIVYKSVLALCKKYGLDVKSLSNSLLGIDAEFRYPIGRSYIEFAYDRQEDRFEVRIGGPIGNQWTLDEFSELNDAFDHLSPFVKKLSSIDLTKIKIRVKDNSYYN